MREVPSTDGVVVAVHDLGGDLPGRPTLLLAHANGFHGRAFAPFAAHLTERYHCLAVDFRGHGDAVTPDGLTYDWSGFIDDVVAVIDAVDLQQPVGFGHSLGGAALIGAEQRRPGTFRALCGFEPIVFPSDMAFAAGAVTEADSPMAVAAEKRREVFGSIDEAIDNFASKPPLGALDPAALRAYVEHGFRPQPDGTVLLKCRGRTEAQIYRMAHRNGVFDHLAEVHIPVTLVSGRAEGMGPTVFAPMVADHLPHGRLERIDSVGHFGPLEDPATVAEVVLRALS